MGQVSFKKQASLNEVKYDTTKDTRLAYIQKKFFFTPNEFDQLYRAFCKMGPGENNSIRIEDMFQFLQEELNSIISPYLVYLFSLIEKETDNSVTFLGWLPAISVYCLYSKEQLVAYVFQMLDQDHDHHISKKDIMKFLVSERFKQKTFPFSYVKAIELMEIERPDKITLDIFKKFQQEVPFLCYPAFRLQDSLVSRIMGEEFWLKVKEKIRMQENQQNKNKQLERIKEENLKKDQIKIDKKIEKFNQIVLENPTREHQFKKNKSIRNRERAVSDSKVTAQAQMPEQMLEELYQQHMLKLHGTLWQAQEAKKQHKEIEQLHWGSKSERYIKKPYKVQNIVLSRREAKGVIMVPSPLVNSIKNAPRKSLFKDFSKQAFNLMDPSKASSESSKSSQSPL